MCSCFKLSLPFEEIPTKYSIDMTEYYHLIISSMIFSNRANALFYLYSIIADEPLYDGRGVTSVNPNASANF